MLTVTWGFAGSLAVTAMASLSRLPAATVTILEERVPPEAERLSGIGNGAPTR